MKKFLGLFGVILALAPPLRAQELSIIQTLPAPFVDRTSFTPTFTFSTPGDLTVSYTMQLGYYSRIGNTVFFVVQENFTPTFTTASGTAQLNLTGIPYSTSMTLAPVVHCYSPSNMTWPGGTTFITGSFTTSGGQQNILSLFGVGTGSAQAVFDTTAFPTATARTVRCAGFFYL